MRLPGVEAERQWGFPFRERAAEEGILSPDHLVRVSRHQSARGAMDQLLSDIRPGVTEVVLRPALDTAELRSVAPDWAARVADHDLAMTADSLQVLSRRERVHLIGYRQLRDLQRR
jgi:hypothetical protein